VALNDFKVHFDNAYEEVVQKLIVGKAIANMRFEKVLSYGETIERVAYDISGVRVRTVTRGSASTIDTISDSAATLTINIEKETAFYLSDGEMTQAGPMNPGTIIGGKVGVKTAIDFDSRVLNEVLNANLTFDQGDLTGSTVNGSPVQLQATSVPQMITRLPAKLKRNNQILANMAFVIDNYVAADLALYLLGKQFDVVNSIFKNGYVEGQVAGAKVYVSENLTGELVITSTSLQDRDTLTIGGVVFQAEESPAAYGEYRSTEFFTELAYLINNPTASVANAYSAIRDTADVITIQDTLGLYCSPGEGSTGSLQIFARGSGRITASEVMDDGRIVQNMIHCYYGKKGAIDVVMQSNVPVDVRKTSDRRGQNIFSSYLAGIKTFTDGSKRFLNVEVSVEAND